MQRPPGMRRATPATPAQPAGKNAGQPHAPPDAARQQHDLERILHHQQQHRQRGGGYDPGRDLKDCLQFLSACQAPAALQLAGLGARGPLPRAVTYFLACSLLLPCALVADS